MRAVSMKNNMPETPLGAHWDKERHTVASAEQTAFSWDAQKRVENDQIALRALFTAMVRKAGGVDWLARALNKEPSYASKITDAINGVKDRKIQHEWLAPMLDDASALELYLYWLSERGHYKPPVRERRVTKEEIAAAALEVVDEMGALKETFRELVAKKLGVRPEDVNL